MDYISLVIRYGIIAAFIVALFIGIRLAPRYGNSTVAPPDYRDMREIPRYSRVSYDGSITLAEYQVGDMVVISRGDNPTTDTFFAWIGALPGDHLGLREGRFVVNDTLLDEIIARRREQSGSIGRVGDGLAEVEPIIIPGQHIFVVSDAHHQDSIAHGLFPTAAVLGRITAVRAGE